MDPSRRLRVMPSAPMICAVTLVLALGSAVGARQQQEQAPSPAAKPGVVRGLVVTAESAQPLAGVQVVVRGGTPETSRSTVTTADGRYEIKDVPPGVYIAWFSKPTFVTLNWGQTSSSAPRKPIRVGAGAVVEAVNISLTAVGAIEGRVVDAKGLPVADMEVTALRIEWIDGTPRLTPAGRRAVTDAKGAYRTVGLLDGTEYVVRASPGSRASESGKAVATPTASGSAPTYYPSTLNVDEAMRVAVRGPQDVSAIDIPLRSVRLAKITGEVLTRGPVEGVVLMLVRSGMFGGLAASTATQTGRFELSGVPPGQYVLQARALPKSVVDEIAMTGNSAPLGKSRETQYATLPLEVVGDDVAGVTVQTAPGGVLRGTVMLGGQPYSLKGLTVTALPADNESLAIAVTDRPIADDGSFEIMGIVGTFVLRVNGTPASARLDRVTSGGIDVTDSGVAVRSGEETSDVQVTLTAGPARLSGRVLGEEASGGECSVIVFSRNDRQWSLPATRYAAAAPIANGSFEVVGLPPGIYYAAAVSGMEKGRERDPEYLRYVIKSIKTTSVTIKAGQDQTIETRCTR